MKQLINKCYNLLTPLRRQIVFNTLWKSLALLSGVFLVPYTIAYLGKDLYGVWATVASILNILIICDFGITNSFRVLYASALQGPNQDANSWIKVVFYSSIPASLLLVTIGFFIIYFFPLASLLNIPLSYHDTFPDLLIVLLLLIASRLILKNIQGVLVANHKTAENSFMQLISAAGIFLLVLWLVETGAQPNIFLYGIILGGLPLISFLITTSYSLISGLISPLKVIRSKISVKMIYSLYQRGGWFFVLQLAGTILLSSDNIIISSLYNPSEVTSYHILSRYFSILLTGMSFVLLPLVPKYQEAYLQGNKRGVLGYMKRSQQFLLLAFISLTIMGVFAETIIEFWTNEDFNYSNEKISLFVLLTILDGFRIIFTFYLTAIGRIKRLAFSLIVGALLNIVLSFWLGTVFFLDGIVLATCLSLFFPVVIVYLEYRISLKSIS